MLIVRPSIDLATSMAAPELVGVQYLFSTTKRVDSHDVIDRMRAKTWLSPAAFKSPTMIGLTWPNKC